MKLILFIHVYDIVLYINYVFVLLRQELVALATFFIFVVIPGQYTGAHLKDHWSSGFISDGVKYALLRV